MTSDNRPSIHGRFLRSRLQSIRQSISEIPVIEVSEGTTDEQGPDGGWGWLVLIAGFFCLAVLDGIAYTFGVFLDPLVVEMKEKRSKVSIAGSMLVATYAFTGPFAAKLVKRYGTRKICMLGALLAAIGLTAASFMTEIFGLIATYSIITGFGFGLMYIPSVVAVANHFTKWRSLAVGICLCGAGMGTFILAPLESYLTELYGRQTTFMVLASFCLLCLLFAIVMRPVKFVSIVEQNAISTENIATTEESTSWIEKIVTLTMERDLYRSSEFNLFLLVVFADVFATFGLFIPYHHLCPVAVQAGLTKTQAAFIISVIGISSTIGRLAAGWLGDRQWLHPATICAISLNLLTPIILIFCVASSYIAFIVLGGFFGFLTGAWIALMSPLFVKVLGLPLLTSAFGFLTGLRGITALAGPPLAAQAVEYFNDRRVALYCSSLLMGISGALFTVSTIWNRGRQLRRQYSQI